jgi:hypothetical protein
VSDVKTLHDEDLLAWSKEQANALRAAATAGSNLDLDWENLAEEIEDLGAAQKSGLHSQVRRIIEHLLKLEYSPARDPRRGWMQSIDNARIEIEYLFQMSPSLKREVNTTIAVETKRAIRLVIRDLEGYEEIDRAAATHLRARTFTEEQILGDWFPPEPGA